MVTYKIFKREVFNRVGKRKRNTLFYWSLFDPSFCEETEQPKRFPNFSRGQRSVLDILKCSRTIRNNLKSAEERKEFKQTFIYNEFLTNYLLAAQIEEKMHIEKLRGKIDILNLEKTVFPDIIIKKTKVGRVTIEIKGKITATNLTDRVKNEVVPKVVGKRRDFNNFLLLLLFPTSRSETGERVKELVSGYYIFEDLLKNQNPGKEYRKVICGVIEITGNKYTLNKISDKIINYIKNK